MFLDAGPVSSLMFLLCRLRQLFLDRILQMSEIRNKYCQIPRHLVVMETSSLEMFRYRVYQRRLMWYISEIRKGLPSFVPVKYF